MFNLAQLYLCGLPGKKLEKLRRLVNAAGGLRFNQPSEELTHVVMGELDQDVNNFISKVTHRSEPQGFINCCNFSTCRIIEMILIFSLFFLPGLM